MHAVVRQPHILQHSTAWTASTHLEDLCHNRRVVRQGCATLHIFQTVQLQVDFRVPLLCGVQHPFSLLHDTFQLCRFVLRDKDGGNIRKLQADTHCPTTQDCGESHLFGPWFARKPLTLPPPGFNRASVPTLRTILDTTRHRCWHSLQGLGPKCTKSQSILDVSIPLRRCTSRVTAWLHRTRAAPDAAMNLRLESTRWSCSRLRSNWASCSAGVGSSALSGCDTATSTSAMALRSSVSREKSVREAIFRLARRKRFRTCTTPQLQTPPGMGPR